MTAGGALRRPRHRLDEKALEEPAAAALQTEYNVKHGITPASIKKQISGSSIGLQHDHYGENRAPEIRRETVRQREEESGFIAALTDAQAAADLEFEELAARLC